MSKKNTETPKISPRAKEFNEILDSLGPPRIRVLPNVLTQQPAPIDIERRKEQERLSRQYDPFA